jgi:predicted RNA-binding Zn-ribbon protein involved in translation (DUF1610 family)
MMLWKNSVADECPQSTNRLIIRAGLLVVFSCANCKINARMTRRIAIAVFGVALVTICAFESRRVWPAIWDISRSESPLLWWTMVILVGVVLEHLLFSAALAVKRLAFGQCLSCGQSLHGVTSGFCPHCGKPNGINRTQI